MTGEMTIDVTGRRVRPDRARLTEMLARAGVADPSGALVEPLAGGTFNSAYRVVAGERRLVLKIAPPPAAAGLTYERGLPATEAAFYRAAAGALAVPEVVHLDTERDLLPTDWLLMTELPGVNWFAGRHRLDDRQGASLRRQLGTAVAGLHRVTGTGFGYPQLGLAADWPTAFTGMIDAVLADAVRYGVELPVPAEALRARLVHGRPALAEVTVPTLVHFDLWPGNVLVDPDPVTVTGVVDGERAFWGDPLAELPSLGLFGLAEEDPDLVVGYRAAGGILELTAAARRRLELYRVYLYLIMTVETVPRGATGPSDRALARLVATHLRAAVDRLAGAGS
ncbi:aminoglycoside phosphotransferase family protein [Micromonospora sp. NBC_01699]|uniref:phosphotransferase family protein n=1 Tax=Micromonospora sp. NBC_01699 TaxID=2975984 RepID=UPI002E316D71|nr:aminoglycoside phosphotransferase family protein [Micromonospora sp. NBC_01699]